MRFLAFLRFELEGLRRRRGEVMVIVAVYLIAVAFHALAQPAGTVGMAGMRATIWVAVFLLSSVAQFTLFDRDRRGGFLEQWPLLPLPLEAVVTAKLLAHWMVYGAAFAIATPVVMLLGALPPATMPQVLLSLIPATACLTMLGGIAAATVLRFRHGDTTGMLLVLPVGVPVLVFASAGTAGLPFLWAVTLVIVPIGVIATSRLLRYPS